MISIIPNRNLSALDIKMLRKFSSLSISEIRSASEREESIRDFHIFKGEWESERIKLAEIFHLFSSDDPKPFQIRESNEHGLNEYLTVEKFRLRLLHWRGIELETQMDIDLELGEIADLHRFTPHDKEWI